MEGTDTWRHFHEGMADRVVLESSGQRVLFQRLETETDPVALSRQYMRGVDLVIAEGFTSATIPKIEVFRSKAHDLPHYNPSRPNAENWIAMVTDHHSEEFPFPSFRFTDTSWLVNISALAWDHAMLIED